MKFKRITYPLLLTIVMAMGLVGCSSTDCPMSNVVRCYYGLYSSQTGESISYGDTISVTAADTTLLNKAVHTSSFHLPMSYNLPADSLTFQFRTQHGINNAQVIVSHKSRAHYTSLECGISFFHTITDVSYTYSSDFPTIDSIVIIKPEVNYDKTENIRIYLSNL